MVVRPEMVVVKEEGSVSVTRKMIVMRMKKTEVMRESGMTEWARECWRREMNDVGENDGENERRRNRREKEQEREWNGGRRRKRSDE